MKFLAVDIGNTNIAIGLFDLERGEGDAGLLKDWRIETRRGATVDEYLLLLKGLLSDDASGIGGSVISCVVPSLKGVFREVLKKLVEAEPVVVGPGTKTGISILTDDPREVGADRIVNALAALRRYGPPVIVVDFGTAVTFDYVTPAGEYAGGAIAPGIGVSMDALFERAARLPRVDVKRPSSIIGKSTIESMRSGIFYGYASLVDGIVKRMAGEAGTAPRVVATGGMAAAIAAECESIDEVDELLTLKGLCIIYEVNSK